MTFSAKHAFQSAKADNLDPTLIQPSNWNEEHVIECASQRVLGRMTAGAGPVEELTFPQIAHQVIPAGTKMLFQQTAAPTGWTKQTTHNNKALRVVSGTAGTGGTHAFSTVFGKTVTDAHALTDAQMPAHTHGSGTLATGSAGGHNHGGSTGAAGAHSHSYDRMGDLIGLAGGGNSMPWKNLSATTNAVANHTHSISTDGAHTHPIIGSTGAAGSGSAHSHGMDIRVQYVDIIIASKD